MAINFKPVIKKRLKYMEITVLQNNEGCKSNVKVILQYTNCTFENSLEDHGNENLNISCLLFRYSNNL